ncbi:MAG: DUF4054 domain-containing protein [Methanobrevibacter sp.]|nr:DUF4054 domain-containing protein [Methanobrevibacter sp.]
MSESVTYPVTTAEFKTWFVRDFPFSQNDNDLSGIVTADIDKAFAEAMFVYNRQLFTDSEYKIAFLYLAAHYLVIDLKNSSTGLKGAFSGLMSSKSVGSVSVGYSLPTWVMENPLYSLIAQTPYGAKYLSLAIARCVGNMAVVKGCTQP